MNLPLLIARRSASHLSPVQRTMKHIATIAISISVAVMIVTIAVVSGFRHQIDKVMHYASADIVVTSPITHTTTTSPEPIRHNAELYNILATTEGSCTVSKFAMCGAIARTADDAASVVVKGIDSDYPLDEIDQLIIEGERPVLDGSRRREVAIPQTLAQKLGVGANGRIELLIIGKGKRPEREIFKVAGIYNASGTVTSQPILFTDIKSAQRINGWEDDQITGYEVKSLGREHSESTAEMIEFRLFYEYNGEEGIQVTTLRRKYQNIYAWLETHDINAIVIVVIMFAVALFNVITALLTMVAERMRMVGILKSLGMSNGAVRRIFLYRIAETLAIGLFVGNIVGISLALVQYHTHVITLNSEAYVIDHVPIALSVSDIITINTIFAVATIAFTALATSIVQRITPAEAVKYE